MVERVRNCTGSSHVALYCAAIDLLEHRVLPELDCLAPVIATQAAAWQDGATAWQAWSGHAARLRACQQAIDARRDELHDDPGMTAPDHGMAQGALDAMVRAHAALRGLAVTLMQVANAMRWPASGPCSSVGAASTPAMVHPAQYEAIVMMAIEVMGNHGAVAFAGAPGHVDVHAMRPIILGKFVDSATMLADGCERFRIVSVEAPHATHAGSRVVPAMV